MAGFRIEGNTSTNVVEVDASNNMNVALPLNPLTAGYARMLGEIDYGRISGTAYTLSAEVSEDYRIRTELDSIFDSHVFNETAQFTGKHVYRNTTMTDTWGGNTLSTNGSGITTLNTGTLFQTYQYFPVFGGAETYAYFSIAVTGTWAVTNTTIDVGLFSAAITTPYAPIDGAYIRINNTGMFGVTNFNGTEQTTSPFKVSSSGANLSPTIGAFYNIIVTLSQNIAVFWIDLRDGYGYQRAGSLVSPIGTGVSASLLNLPFSIRHAIGGTAASGIIGLKCSAYTITQGGFQNTRSEQVTAALATGGHQGQAGHTQGSTALYTNSLAPTAGAVMTNTTAALGVGLGGQFSCLPTLAANTDGILCSYLNPISTTAITGKQLIIKGVKIDAIVTTVLAGNSTPTIFAHSLAYGHNALSLATTEAATTKAPRRVYLGIQSFAAAAALGTIASSVTMNFDRPIPVNSGEYVAIATKNLGAVTTSGVVTFLVTFDWAWVL
jgi:hypothetical protein